MEGKLRKGKADMEVDGIDEERAVVFTRRMRC